MIKIYSSAQNYFSRLLTDQGLEGHVLRIEVLNPGTPRAECELAFVEQGECPSDDVAIQLDQLSLSMAHSSAPYLESAELEFVSDQTGGQLVVRAPDIKGKVPASDAPLREQVEYWLDAEINPMVAAHGGMVGLEKITEDNDVVLRFGGGCHGCGMVGVTLKQGIEKTLREKISGLGQIIDATDHASGENPYFEPA